MKWKRRESALGRLARWLAPQPTLPLVGRVDRRSEAEAGGVGVAVIARDVSTNNDPTPNPSPQGGGEHTESVAAVIESNGMRASEVHY